jgi:LacI family transcriptional regulator
LRPEGYRFASQRFGFAPLPTRDTIAAVARKRTVLLALTDAHHGFFRGVARYARDHNWHLDADMIYTAKIPIGWQGDGIIAFIGYRDDLAEFIRSSRLPTVEISMGGHDLKVPRVLGDNEMIGRLAAEHFLERGYRHFAWAPLMDDIVNAERYRGFANRLAKEKFTCHVLSPANSRSAPSSTCDWAVRRRALMQELCRLPKPLAAFGYNDCVAADLIDACDDANLLVPEAVAVMGVDNDTMLCECLRVPLSSVCHNLEGMAYQAAVLLNRLMAGKKAPKEVLRVPPTGVVTRRSTDILAVNNLEVAKALRFIHDQYSNPLLGVDDVVAATNLSRRPLEKAFHNELKRTLHDEIIRIRLQRVKHLLVTTGLSIKKLSQMTGFSSPNYLHRAFRDHVHTTPRKYRAQQTSRALSK